MIEILFYRKEVDIQLHNFVIATGLNNAQDKKDIIFQNIEKVIVHSEFKKVVLIGNDLWGSSDADIALIKVIF